MLLANQDVLEIRCAAHSRPMSVRRFNSILWRIARDRSKFFFSFNVDEGKPRYRVTCK